MLFESVLFAACTSETPVSVVSRLLSALNRASDAAESLNPASSSDCPGAIAAACVVTPAPSKVFPATDTKTGNPEVLIACPAM